MLYQNTNYVINLCVKYRINKKNTLKMLYLQYLLKYLTFSIDNGTQWTIEYPQLTNRPRGAKQKKLAE